MRRLAVALVAALGVSAAAAGPAHAGDPDAPDEPPDAPPIELPFETPVIELYTMGPGELVFEKFGHAALCVVYPSGRPHSRCYNYGTTDFDSVVPLFWGFLRGRSLFWVSTSSPEAMLNYYADSDRSLWLQELDLDREAARRVARHLAHDALEANRYYAYHHYNDNCSTRVRDVIDEATGGALSAARPGAPDYPSYRELSRLGFHEWPGMLLVSDVLLGRAADVHPDAYRAMFLPDILRAEVEARLGVIAELIEASEGQPDAFQFDADPSGARWVWIVAALLLAAPVALARWHGRRERIALAVAFMPLALLALVLWAIAVVSPLPELRWNEALLVLVPTDAALPFLRGSARGRYLRVRIAMLALVSALLVFGLFRQPLWLLVPVPLLPLMLAAWPTRSDRLRTGGITGAALPPEGPTLPDAN
jgi:hypothetical protein